MEILIAIISFLAGIVTGYVLGKRNKNNSASGGGSNLPNSGGENRR